VRHKVAAKSLQCQVANSRDKPITTAIGLEERSECFRYWVAASRQPRKVIGFLQGLLEFLKRLFLLSGQQAKLEEKEILQTCIDFSRARIAKEAKFLGIAITNCRKILLNKPGSEGT
jgi:hypothetical protein